MLNLPHIAPLTAYVEELRKRDLGYIPYFDPMDGGINAKVLFLLEKPGPKTFNDPEFEKPGSGFISRNNNDPTAEATFNFMEQAQIPRDATVIWNVIPGWNGEIKYFEQERQRGVCRGIDHPAPGASCRGLCRCASGEGNTGSRRQGPFLAAIRSPLITRKKPMAFQVGEHPFSVGASSRIPVTAAATRNAANSSAKTLAYTNR